MGNSKKATRKSATKVETAPVSAKKKKKTKAGGSSSSTAAASDVFPPQLLQVVPSTQPQPSRPTNVETLHPSVWVARQFLSPQECQAWIDYCEASGGSQLEYTSHPASRSVAHRECFRLQRQDADTAQRLFRRMQAAGVVRPPNSHPDLDQPVGCNPNLRIYKYEEGDSFGKHIDDSNRIRDEHGQYLTTRVTVLVYLSDCEGGATRFYPPRSNKKSFAFEPEVGAILCHVHGDACLEHEADAVTRGTKYILRTDLVYR